MAPLASAVVRIGPCAESTPEGRCRPALHQRAKGCRCAPRRFPTAAVATRMPRSSSGAFAFPGAPAELHDERESGVDIIVKAKNCEVPARIKEDVLAKVEHATRFFDRLTGVEVVFSEEHNPRIAEPAVVEVTARTKGHHIRAEGAAADHRAAVDAAVTRFERQLAKYKARQVDRVRGRDRSGPAVGVTAGHAEPLAPEAPTDNGPAAQIVRTKRFTLRPMHPEEAALQLELLGHEFFLFTHAATGASSVVYRRRDGQMGMIEGVVQEE
ncbi:MAG: ribosome-associated translation inhibitor RaiA [Nitriliruptorales bacterium]|nr:ribosome-associated translation inhibitor RaiA [Nitriliruptorales bacterium]